MTEIDVTVLDDVPDIPALVRRVKRAEDALRAVKTELDSWLPSTSSDKLKKMVTDALEPE